METHLTPVVSTEAQYLLDLEILRAKQTEEGIQESIKIFKCMGYSVIRDHGYISVYDSSGMNLITGGPETIYANIDTTRDFIKNFHYQRGFQDAKKRYEAELKTLILDAFDEVYKTENF